MESFPSFADDKGRVVLLTKTEMELEDFEYSEDMHFAVLADKSGISLERVNFDRQVNEKSNWQSAAQRVGFATPGYQNSQFKKDTNTDEKISIDPELFSPDNDGYNDQVFIKYLLDSPGYVANVKIYDSRGRLVRELVKNELLSTNGAFSWDGTDENHGKARIGIYVIYIEFFDLSGKVKKYKKTCVVAGKLD
jgi:hypothetical protein